MMPHKLAAPSGQAQDLRPLTLAGVIGKTRLNRYNKAKGGQTMGETTNKTQTQTRERIEKLGEKARADRLSGNAHNGANHPYPLHGYCFDNALVAYRHLTEAGYEPTVVVGANERYASELVERGVDLSDLDSVQDLEGWIHYWVEAPIEGETYVVDIASNTHERDIGSVYVGTELPDDYYRFEDSYETGQETLNEAHERGHRCLHCGGQNGACGCPEQSDVPDA